MVSWGELAFAALVGAGLIDLTLFGYAVRALGLGAWFDGPAPGERVLFDRRAGVHRGPLVWGWHWLGRVLVTDRRLVSTWGLCSRVAVLDVPLSQLTAVEPARYYLYPAVRVRYRDGTRVRALLIRELRLGRGGRDALLQALRAAGGARQA
jgi:hypothetical protein